VPKQALPGYRRLECSCVPALELPEAVAMQTATIWQPNGIVVTGAGGFLGSEIIRQAVAAGLSVRATDRTVAGPQVDVPYVSADIVDPSSLTAAIEMAECVIHAAGLAHVWGSRQQAAAPFTAVNEMGTRNVAHAAVRSGVRHLVLVSSVSVYGQSSALGVDEATQCQPQGPYAVSKWRAEQQAAEVVGGSQTALTILRLATAYGEGDPGNVARLMRAIDRGRFLWIGDGTNRKSLIHREDAARACLVAACRQPAGMDVYNVSAPVCTMREIVQVLASALGRRVPGWHVPAPWALALASAVSRLPGDRFRRLPVTVQKWLEDDYYAADKIKHALGYEPLVDLSTGIGREVAWYRGNRASG
jgi:nucleoside-diphosphate-sugar epimerase